MRTTALMFVCGACLMIIPQFPLAGDDFTLQPIRVTSNVPVKITISGGPTVNSPIYRTSQGEWKQLKVDKSGTAVSFSPPEDALASTVILLNKPKWLQLPDEDPPVFEAVSMDGSAVTVADTVVKLGHLSQTPKTIMLTLGDRKNPIHPGRASISIDGREPKACGGAVKLDQSADGKHLDLIITIGDLPKAPHTVFVSVCDASPSFNTATLQMEFTTAPLLANGDFELADKNGAPTNWSSSTWSSDANTKADIKVVDGGRSGKCLMIDGIAGSLNIVCGQAVDLIPGRTYVLSGYYKTDADRGYASIIAQNKATGKQDQYSNMPGLKKADDWALFSWEFTAKEDNTGFVVYLRSGGVGKVYFDDIEVEAKQ